LPTKENTHLGNKHTQRKIANYNPKSSSFFSPWITGKEVRKAISEIQSLQYRVDFFVVSNFNQEKSIKNLLIELLLRSQILICVLYNCSAMFISANR